MRKALNTPSLVIVMILLVFGFHPVTASETTGLLIAVAGPEGTDSAGLPRPSVELGPGDVVRIVIEALSHNDRPFEDAGIETTFNFASPANRVNTGPLDRFARMVKGPAYGVMVDHASHAFSEVVEMGDKAYQMVELQSADGRTTVFAFRLGLQQEGEYAGMWMTDAVWPVASKAEPGQYL